MTSQVLIDACCLSAQALVGQRIAKRLPVDQGVPTAADKRPINDTVDELWWQATLKPGTVAKIACGREHFAAIAEGANAARFVRTTNMGDFSKHW
jgi:hypothetical protein